ncbi:helix-turn-helix domain-containing protein [Pantoea allii]|uniref:helix-turn-helix domain-containing protein n=1 Tax=Pantoea allii TaxID=574096 RepID=UPI000BB40458|nr:helix-turn-helix transcriptional regulator [Pantoea allii]MBW1252694.1 helix-turn-helix domain-containing protein [Pantoea allii]MBW1262041.1 helix-turn-helix domain-containing protein [Pantoea allii]MBW1284062.1 helix-turn-helix domain-containing protein [Pantoea allii]PBK01501.1 hypothetical protein CMR03_03320 [Pantoea allii]
MENQDWHPADIIAGIKKQETALSRKAGLALSTLANALTRPWPKGESLIAAALGVKPEKIWRSRYSHAAVLPGDATNANPQQAKSPLRFP